MSIVIDPRPVRPHGAPQSSLNGTAEDIWNALQSTPEGRALIAKATSAATSFATQKIAENFKSAQFYSAYSKPIVYTAKNLTDFITGKVASLTSTPPPTPRPPPRGAPVGIQPVELPKQKSLLERVKPTFVIEGSFGKKVIAPYGEADPKEWRGNVRNLILGAVGVLALYTAGAYYLGYKKGQRSK